MPIYPTADQLEILIRVAKKFDMRINKLKCYKCRQKFYDVREPYMNSKGKARCADCFRKRCKKT